MFAYCRNNPVNRIDVSGTYDEEIADGEADTPIDDEGPSNTGGGVNVKSNSKAFTSAQRDIVDWGQEYKGTGISEEDAKVLVDMAKENNIKSHYPMIHEHRSGIWSRVYHISLNGMHIRVFKD